MCYDIQAQTLKKLKFAKIYGYSPETIAELEQTLQAFENRLEPYYHVSAFEHPEILCLNHRLNPFFAQWGLVPAFVKDAEQAKQLAAQTPNARVESVHEKPSFKNAIANNRCVVAVEAYYEHHHVGKYRVPFRFYQKNKAQFLLAAIFEEGINPLGQGKIKTFSILTTKGNDKAVLIHNHGKNGEARMPLILDTKESVEAYLHEGFKKNVLVTLANRAKKTELYAHAVSKIRGINTKHLASSINKVVAPELGLFMPSEL